VPSSMAVRSSNMQNRAFFHQNNNNNQQNNNLNMASAHGTGKKL
jgi:hypothetical protein